MLETFNLCLEGPILRICSGYHSNSRIRATISCGKFVAERTLKGSIGSRGAAILQMLMVQHLDKEHLIGVNFTQSKDNNRTSLYIKVCDQKVKIFNCNQCLQRVLIWVFVKTDFKFHWPEWYAKVKICTENNNSLSNIKGRQSTVK